MLGRSGLAEARGGIVYKKKVAFRRALFIQLENFSEKRSKVVILISGTKDSLSSIEGSEGTLLKTD